MNGEEKLTHAKDIDVFYSDTDLGLTDYKPYEYISKHIESGNKNRRTIWCRNQEDFLKIIDMWNYWAALRPVTLWVYYSTSFGFR